MRHKLYAGSPEKFPTLLIGSKIRWLGIHVRGGTIAGKLLIPLLPEHQRMGRKAFRRVIDGLMRSGNAFFIEKNGKVILMAENIKENCNFLRRFKRAERHRSGAKSIKRGQEIPITVLMQKSLHLNFFVCSWENAQAVVAKQRPCDGWIDSWPDTDFYWLFGNYYG